MHPSLNLTPEAQRSLERLYEERYSPPLLEEKRPALDELITLGLVTSGHYKRVGETGFIAWLLTTKGRHVVEHQITFEKLEILFTQLKVFDEKRTREILSFFPQTSAYWNQEEIGLCLYDDKRITINGVGSHILVHCTLDGILRWTKVYYGEWDHIIGLAQNVGIRRDCLRYQPDYYEYTARTTGIRREDVTPHAEAGVLLDFNDLMRGQSFTCDQSVALEIFQRPLGNGFICGGCIVFPRRASFRGGGYDFETDRAQLVCPKCLGAKGFETHDYDYTDYNITFKTCDRCDGKGWVTDER